MGLQFGMLKNFIHLQQSSLYHELFSSFTHLWLASYLSGNTMYFYPTDVECGWCKRTVSLSSPEFLASPEGPRYCTESCFSQSRRASFKRAKTCDWCKHVRHAVSYVDFHDGASQLQFCSDKCLNQYKMQIFCKETQAHLDMNPHLKEKSSGNDGKTKNKCYISSYE